MYRIYINSKIEKCAEKFAVEIRKGKPYKSELAHFKQNLTCLDRTFEKKAKEYVQLVIDVYKKSPTYPTGNLLQGSILIAKSSFFDEYIRMFENIIPPNKLKTVIEYTNSNGTVCKDAFWSVLVRVMDYGRFKSKYYECIEDIGIETCVYCNMSPADKCDANFANYQMEHFYPKNTYPFLSTSFFNFFPCCSTCNTKKGKKVDKDGFNLYRENISDCANPFEFTTSDAICYYMKFKNDKSKFEKEKKIGVFFKALTNHGKKQIKKLQMEKRYNCNRVRRKMFELLFRYERNTKTQINITGRTFPKLNSLHVGNVYDVFGDFSKEEDIHREQLTKFSIDFGKETGML